MNTSERKYSIVMTCYDQATELESNLSAFLNRSDGRRTKIVQEQLSSPLYYLLAKAKHIAFSQKICL